MGTIYGLVIEPENSEELFQELFQFFDEKECNASAGCNVQWPDKKTITKKRNKNKLRKGNESNDSKKAQGKRRSELYISIGN